MMGLSNRHKIFLVIEQAVLPSIINFFLNGAVAWFIFQSLEMVPMWAKMSVGIDILATSFFLPFFTCVFVSLITPLQLRYTGLPILSQEQLPQNPWYQKSILVRSSFVGALGIILAGVPLVLVLHFAEVEAFAINSFIIFKAIWTAIFALAISPLLAWWAFASASLLVHGLEQKEMQVS